MWPSGPPSTLPLSRSAHPGDPVCPRPLRGKMRFHGPDSPSTCTTFFRPRCAPAAVVSSRTPHAAAQSAPGPRAARAHTWGRPALSPASRSEDSPPAPRPPFSPRRLLTRPGPQPARVPRRSLADPPPSPTLLGLHAPCAKLTPLGPLSLSSAWATRLPPRTPASRPLLPLPLSGPGQGLGGREEGRRSRSSGKVIRTPGDCSKAAQVGVVEAERARTGGETETRSKAGETGERRERWRSGVTEGERGERVPEE